jgi:hypothetical protein
MLPANKPILADSMWSMLPADDRFAVGDNIQYVIDGGSLLH